ncbi:MAG: hypothetical protein FWD82_01575, partial [Defluviitaleaceae bacterium]|nr:hypothetical protein [Defluviitaleaceae bacterium]
PLVRGEAISSGFAPPWHFRFAKAVFDRFSAGKLLGLASPLCYRQSTTVNANKIQKAWIATPLRGSQ